MSVKYLYGASVHGIQDFIFKTNKLAEIVGASEIVEQICTVFFENHTPNFNKSHLILGAAGNIKYIFDSKEDCEYVVKHFPKVVMEKASGITISQAIVELNTENISGSIEKLELRLKVQKNKPVKPTEIGFMGVERARRTGGVATEFKESEAQDAATKAKLEAKDQTSLFEKISGKLISSKEFPFDIAEITKSGKNSWIAVIHADGNGLGKIIQNNGVELNKDNKFKQFSEAIDNATKNAIKIAFDKVIDSKRNEFDRYPIRPILIGGDDVTVIIRADLALEFTEIFLKNFENESERLFSKLGIKNYEKGLTACAGIAFIKESYPLHYGLHLAESLCKDAKSKVKKESQDGKLMDPHYDDMPKSALAFYKVQESFIEDLKTLKERTLETNNGLSYYAGPYLLEGLKNLNSDLNHINKEADNDAKTKAVGKLRQIISETYKDKSTAVFMMERMKKINNDFYEKLNLDAELDYIKEDKVSKLLDLITLHSFNYGNRNN